MTAEAALKKVLLAVSSANGEDGVGRLLPTLRVDVSLIVVLDRGERDHMAAACRAWGIEHRRLDGQTDTEIANIAAMLASRRGCDYLLLVRDDLVFTSDVARQLLAEMEADPRLGIVSPSRVDGVTGEPRQTTYRCVWDLGSLEFTRDGRPPDDRAGRIEADYCELDCALVRLSALSEIGILDEAYGSHLGDADLGFRLRVAGYGSAYLTTAQVASEAPASEDPPDMEASRALFARKFLGYGVHHKAGQQTDVTSWGIVNRYLHRYLDRNGLLHPDRRELTFTHPGQEPFDYLYTAWETTQLPAAWRGLTDSYRAVFTASEWNRAVFQDAGYRNVHTAPLGVETDVFHPAGLEQRFYEERTFLWFSRNQYRKALDVLLRSWARFRTGAPGARLIVMGAGVLESMSHAPASIRHWRGFIVADYPEEGIALWEVVAAISERELAAIYRSVDVVVSNSRSEGFGFIIGEAMACGTLTIFPGYGAAREFAFEGALLLRGDVTPAHYGDRGYQDVGSWWEPDSDHLVSLMSEAHGMDAAARREVTGAAVRVIRQRFTWRHTCTALRAGLLTLQEQKATRPAGARLAQGLSGIAEPDEPAPPDVQSGAIATWWSSQTYRLSALRRIFTTMRYEQGTWAAITAIGQRATGFVERRLRR